MSGKGSEEKTEKPTPKKLRESRKEGQVARTPELGAWAGVLALAMSLHWLVGLGIGKIRNLMGETLVAIDRPSGERALSLLGDASQLILILSAGLGTFILVIAVIGAVAQGGLFFATKALKPKWSRLNPLEGAKRLFGPHALWEGAKMLIKSSLVGVFVYRAVQDLMPMLGGLVPLSVAMEIAAEAATGLMRDVAAAGLVAAAADYAMSRRRTMKQVRMSKKEIRDEHKNSEGDPLIKSALRSRQLAAARRTVCMEESELKGCGHSVS